MSDKPPDIDPKSLPATQTCRDGVFWSMHIPDAIETLTRMHSAIRKWQAMSEKDFQEFRDSLEQEHAPAGDESVSESLIDECSVLLEVERAMFASLGIAIAATVENLVIEICQCSGVNCTKENGMTDFNVACRCLGCKKKIMLAQLPGYQGNHRARMLGNCFKHNDGRKSKKFVKQDKNGVVGDRIEYEKEDWAQMIDRTRQLLESICKSLK